MKKDPLPQKFGRYVLLSRLAKGGMAEVFKAKSLGSDGFEKQLCIKRILGRFEDEDDFIEMLIDEAKISAQLSHPNIIGVHDLGEVEGQYYIAMDFIDGWDLRHIIRNANEKKILIPQKIALYIFDEVLKGLQFAHEFTDAQGKSLNIIHRDISPQNVLVSRQAEIKLGDFGIALSLDKEHETQTGVLKGKFAYMSPEQSRGEYLSPASDLFSMGVMFFELLTGNKPFGAGNDIDVLQNIRQGKIKWPENVSQYVSKDLKKILLQALASDVNKRFRSAAEFRRALSPLKKAEGEELKQFLDRLENSNAEATQAVPAPLLSRADIILKETLQQNSTTTTQSIALDDLPPPVSKILEQDDQNDQRPAWAYQLLTTLIMVFVLIGILSYAYTAFFPEEQQNESQLIANKPSQIEPSATEDIQIVKVIKEEPKPSKGKMTVQASPRHANIKLRYKEQSKKGKKTLSLSDILLEDKENPIYLEVSAAGFKTKIQKIILSEKYKVLNVHLKKLPSALGGIYVNALPWGKVSITGLVQNRSTPYSRKGLKAGSYWVRVSNGSGSIVAKRSVSIKKGRVAKCFVNFEKGSKLYCR